MKKLLAKSGAGLLFGKGFEIELNRFADVGDGLVDRPPLRVATL